MPIDLKHIVAVRFQASGFKTLCTAPIDAYLCDGDRVEVVLDGIREIATCLCATQVINTGVLNAINAVSGPQRIGRIVGRYLYESYEEPDKDNADKDNIDKDNIDKEVDAIDA